MGHLACHRTSAPLKGDTAEDSCKALDAASQLCNKNSHEMTSIEHDREFKPIMEDIQDNSQITMMHVNRVHMSDNVNFVNMGDHVPVVERNDGTLRILLHCVKCQDTSDISNLSRETG